MPNIQDNKMYEITKLYIPDIKSHTWDNRLYVQRYKLHVQDNCVIKEITLSYFITCMTLCCAYMNNILFCKEDLFSLKFDSISYVQDFLYQSYNYLGHTICYVASRMYNLLSCTLVILCILLCTTYYVVCATYVVRTKLK